MNIFVLSRNPAKAARMHCDKHVVKMIVESAQLLCNAHHHLHKTKYAEYAEYLYKPTHMKHPCTQWIQSHCDNYDWLYRLFLALLTEYEFRYGKIHRCNELCHWLCHNPVNGWDVKRQTVTLKPTPFVQAMPKQYQHKNPVTAYRNYYIHEKAQIAKWTKRKVPTWWHAKEVVSKKVTKKKTKKKKISWKTEIKNLKLSSTSAKKYKMELSEFTPGMICVQTSVSISEYSLIQVTNVGEKGSIWHNHYDMVFHRFSINGSVHYKQFRRLTENEEKQLPNFLKHFGQELYYKDEPQRIDWESAVKHTPAECKLDISDLKGGMICVQTNFLDGDHPLVRIKSVTSTSTTSSEIWHWHYDPETKDFKKESFCINEAHFRRLTPEEEKQLPKFLKHFKQKPYFKESKSMMTSKEVTITVGPPPPKEQQTLIPDGEMNWEHSVQGNGLKVWICAHGIEHPDPDSVKELEAKGRYGYDSHACDGCCKRNDFPGKGKKKISLPIKKKQQQQQQQLSKKEMDDIKESFKRATSSQARILEQELINMRLDPV